MSVSFSTEDYWRSIILYGLNVATYKIALARCLHSFVQSGTTTVSYDELANEFFDQYSSRLTNGMPQLDNPARQTKMEYVVNLFNLGRVDRNEAIEFT